MRCIQCSQNFVTNGHSGEALAEMPRTCLACTPDLWYCWGKRWEPTREFWQQENPNSFWVPRSV